MKWLPFVLLMILLTGCGIDKEADNISSVDAACTAPTDGQRQTLEPVALEDTVLLHPLINPEEEDFVRVSDYIPNALIELKYCTSDNFTGELIYEFEEAFLRYGTVLKLKAVAEELAGHGLSLKIWDGFRPVSAQFRLWEVCPDPAFVANPNRGYSNHSRGFAVDLTLVDENGNELEMPTGFDDFSKKADRDYSDCTDAARQNARLLEKTMEKHGFSGYQGEWWHFNDTRKYDVEICFDPGLISGIKVANDAPVLKQYWDPHSELLTVPAGEYVTLLGYVEEFALIEYWGYRGYLSMDNLT